MKTRNRFCSDCRQKARLVEVDMFSNIFPVKDEFEGFEVVYCAKCEKYFFADALPPKPNLVLIKKRTEGIMTNKIRG